MDKILHLLPFSTEFNGITDIKNNFKIEVCNETTCFNLEKDDYLKHMFDNKVYVSNIRGRKLFGYIIKLDQGYYGTTLKYKENRWTEYTIIETDENFNSSISTDNTNEFKFNQIMIWDHDKIPSKDLLYSLNILFINSIVHKEVNLIDL